MADLRALAEAAMTAEHGAARMQAIIAYEDATRPFAILTLLDERDRLRAALERAAILLGDHGPDTPRSTPQPVEALWVARAALADAGR